MFRQRRGAGRDGAGEAGAARGLAEWRPDARLAPEDDLFAPPPSTPGRPRGSARAAPPLAPPPRRRSAVGALLYLIWRAAFGVGLAAAALCLCVGVVLGAATWEKVRLLPDDPVTLIDGRQRGSVTVLDQAGSPLGVRGQRLEPITVAQASRPLIDAILSAEDRRFYWHLGLDPIGLARALTVNYRLGYNAQGGSTITQQVAKLAFLSRERTFARKLAEAPWALALEWAYEKDDILTIYLNRAYLGAASFGFEAAAQRYFGKSARDVTAAQAALLAGLLRAPSRWSPEVDFAGAQARAEVVLRAMADARILSATAQTAARAEVAAMRPRIAPEFAPHYVDWIADERAVALLAAAQAAGDPALAGLDLSQLDLVVSTTLDRRIQFAAEAAIAAAFAQHPKAKRNDDAEAAMVVLSTDGAVRAMVGGRSYGESVFNRAAQAKRQVGSAFKPVVYAAALESGLRPNANVKDAPVRYGRWRPKNYGRYRGWITLETALSVSSNAAAVRLMARVGPKRVAAMAERLGYAPGVRPFPSIALGAVEASLVEVASTYAVFARRGLATPAHAIREIRTPDGRLLWRRPEDPKRAILRRSHAGWITSMMRSVVDAGTGRRARMPDFRPIAGKTGTTQSARDVWFAGFTNQYVGVVWVGKDDNTALRGKVVGGNLPAEIWREAMIPIHAGLPLAALPQRRIPGGYRHAGLKALEAAAAEAAAQAEAAAAEAAGAEGGETPPAAGVAGAVGQGGQGGQGGQVAARSPQPKPQYNRALPRQKKAARAKSPRPKTQRTARAPARVNRGLNRLRPPRRPQQAQRNNWGVQPSRQTKPRWKSRLYD